MIISVRPAKVADAMSACTAVCRSIERCCVQDHRNDPERLAAWLRNKTPENFERWVSSDQHFCAVAEAGATLVGFAMCSHDELLLCYVVPEALRQGVGRTLVQAAEQRAASAGSTALQLESTRTALAFYQRHGYGRCGPPALFAGMEGYPMVKRLTPQRPQPGPR